MPNTHGGAIPANRLAPSASAPVLNLMAMNRGSTLRSNSKNSQPRLQHQMSQNQVYGGGAANNGSGHHLVNGGVKVSPPPQPAAMDRRPLHQVY